MARIRSFLAGTSRNRSTLSECQRLLSEAQDCAAAMQGIAEVNGDSFKANEAAQLVQRQISPLSKEVNRALQELGREELFGSAQQQSQSQSNSQNYYNPPGSDMESLIQSSDDLLRESQSILAETEQVGTRTLLQMGQQRDQLENTNRHLDAVQAAAVQAKNILQSMSRRACRSRMALYTMIALLLASNLYVLYKIYQKKHPAQPDSPES